MTRQRIIQEILAITVAVVFVLGAVALVNVSAVYAQGPNQTPCPQGNMMGMMGSNGMIGGIDSGRHDEWRCWLHGAFWPRYGYDWGLDTTCRSGNRDEAVNH